MAVNILAKYGIKEVADVMFYKINDNGSIGAPVLYLDTLKVSTIEQTAEEASANGGKGNAPLIIWDYGKEITVTLEDALFSAKSMALMFGDGDGVGTTITAIHKTVAYVADATNDAGPTKFAGPQGKEYSIASATDTAIYDADGVSKGASPTNLVVGNTYYKTFVMPLKADTYGDIEISANSFPGTYYVTGDTYARSETTGRDEFFQFIIPKAKVQSENTITLEADGDPSVFNLNLRVLRPADGIMMRLVKYDMQEITN